MATLFSLSSVSASARAGGGGSSGSGSSFSSGSSGSNTSGGVLFPSGRDPYYCGGCCCHGHRALSFIQSVIAFVLITMLAFLPAIIKKLRSRVYNLRIIKQLNEKQIKHSEVSERVKSTYFILQNAWTNGNLEPAKEFLTDQLYSSYKIKLDWMRVANKKNVLKSIKLLNYYPVFVVNSDKKITITYYIKGKMIDYTVDVESQEIVEGSSKSKSFVEYWSFVKTEESDWRLDKIYQENDIYFSIK